MKPQPVVVTTICSMCDQPWEAHGDKPTTEDCIRLLKQQLAMRPVVKWVQPYQYPSWPYTTWNGNFCSPAPAIEVSATAA